MLYLSTPDHIVRLEFRSLRNSRSYWEKAVVELSDTDYDR